MCPMKSEHSTKIFYHFCNLENIVIERDQDLKGIDTESYSKKRN